MASRACEFNQFHGLSGTQITLLRAPVDVHLPALCKNAQSLWAHRFESLGQQEKINPQVEAARTDDGLDGPQAPNGLRSPGAFPLDRAMMNPDFALPLGSDHKQSVERYSV